VDPCRIDRLDCHCGRDAALYDFRTELTGSRRSGLETFKS
jgi:hypothetical protein